jgi:hypothetical protein
MLTSYTDANVAQPSIRLLVTLLFQSFDASGHGAT